MPTCVSKDKETIIVTTVKMRGAHILLCTRKTLVIKLNLLLEVARWRDENIPIKQSSRIYYTKRVVTRQQ